MAEHGSIPVERVELGANDIELSPDAIWSTLGRGGFSRTKAMKERAEELLALGRELIEPRAIGRIYRCEELASEEIDELPNPIRNAALLFFGLSTAGRAIDDRARSLCDAGELIDSMILDAVAITGLSLIGDRLGRAAFEWTAEQGLSASRSFSPGAGSSGWPLEAQRFVFRYLPGDRLGVRLTPHCLMQPSKSVSFVIGIGEHVVQAKHPFSCEGCTRFDCAYRHIPGDEMVERNAA